jgi:protein-disulfide isomerase
MVEVRRALLGAFHAALEGSDAMTTPQQPTKKQRREQARQERREQEAAAQARQQRTKRIWQLGAVLAAAAVVVVIAIVISSSGGSSKSAPPKAGQPASGVAQMTALLNGIPQKGNVLGNAKAPVTMQEFADLQCPICQAYTANSLPTLIKDYVRTGKVKMVFHNLPILGPDSQRAAQVAAGAAQQDKLWNFTELFYENQGTENTGYVTPAFLAKIAKGAGVTSAALTQPPSAAVKAQLVTDQALSDKYGFSATPSFLLSKTGGTPAPLSQVDVTDPSSFSGEIDSLLGKNQ